jgi:glycosyltransferase involved in cell wall biosynthesis
MKLAFVSQEYPPETAHGGIASQTFVKATGMAKRGHQVYVLSASTDGQRHSRQDRGVEVIRVPGFDTRLELHTEPARWLTHSAVIAAELAALQARVSLDLIDFPEYGAEAYVHLLNRTAWNRIPAAIHLQGPLVMLARTIGWPEKDSELYRIGTHMEQTCLRLCDAVYSSSACSAAWCAREYGVKGDIPVMHAGVDTSRFAPASANQARPVIVFAGRVAASKGVDILLDAVCRIARDWSDLRLRLVGRVDETYGAALRARAEARGFKGLELAGQVAHEKLRDELVAGQIFAAPSRYEGGPGFVYLEAMACGLPVIGCSGSGVAESIEHGRTGFLVPPEDPEALALQLQALLFDARLRSEVGQRARRHAVDTLDQERCAERFEAFYRAVIARAA